MPPRAARGTTTTRTTSGRRGAKVAAAPTKQSEVEAAADDEMRDSDDEEEKKGESENEHESSDDDEEDDDEDDNARHNSASSSAAAAAASSGEFDFSALIAQASTALATKLCPTASTSTSKTSTKTQRPRHTRPTVEQSRSNLDELFARSDMQLASTAAAIPAGFLRKSGVLHLTTSAETAAAAQCAEDNSKAATTTAPDLLAQIGSSTKLPLFNPTQQRKNEMKNAPPTAGANWFNFSRPSQITPDMKRDLQLLSLRAYMDPKKFYKKESKKKKLIPTFFQMGTVIAGAQDFYSSRLAKKERTEHYADAFVDSKRKHGEVKKTLHYLKRKQMEVQQANQPAPKHFNKKRKQLEDASKRPGHSKKKKTNH